MFNVQSTPISTLPAADSRLAELGLNAEQKAQKNDDKNQFLELMIAQLENQNPLDPQEGGEFLAQLAQFSTVDGIERLNESTNQMVQQFRSGQALEAAALVGRSVSVVTDRFSHDGQGIQGQVQVNRSTSNVRLQVTNIAGEVVRDIDLGERPRGDAAFTWDGMNNANDPMPAGLYKISAFTKVNDGEEQLLTEIAMNVDSVTLGQGGQVDLNINDYGTVSIDEVRKIQ